jgi:hypothetical protein
LDNAISLKIQFEIEQIDELMRESSPLFNLCKIREPDFVEKCGIAMILHSFYNGIENILLLIIKNKDSKLPNGTKWHKELFGKSFEESKNRTKIFREELKVPLNEYLQFRHFVRHSYGFQLKWEKIKNMFFDTAITHQMTKDAYSGVVVKDEDIMLLLAGDNDYVPVIEDLVLEGFKVIVLFWDHAGLELKTKASAFISLNQHFKSLTKILS